MVCVFPPEELPDFWADIANDYGSASRRRVCVQRIEGVEDIGDSIVESLGRSWETRGGGSLQGRGGSE